MSLQFNDTTTYRGIVQVAEDEAGLDRGVISGNTERLKKAAAHANLAWDDYVPIALKAQGRWQFDDTNHQDSSGNYEYPIIKTNLVQGQRDYTFASDEQGNLILHIDKAAILESATATTYATLETMDELQGHNDIIAEDTTQGVPLKYAKLTNGVQLDTPPSYNATNGLKLYIAREPSYFTYADTTKKPGCPGSHHKYFALKVALAFTPKESERYARLVKEIMSFEGAEEAGVKGSIERHFARRNRDERPIITPKKIKFI